MFEFGGEKKWLNSRVRELILKVNLGEFFYAKLSGDSSEMNALFMQVFGGK